jgi:hypothetical protein
MFSIIFVDLQDYMLKFEDCVDDNGKPIPLTEKLSVKEIKERLDSVRNFKFYISDTNDTQLLSLISFISMMYNKSIIKTDEYGVQYEVPIRCDLFGFNCQGYDDIMIKALLMYYNRFDKTKYLLTKLKNINDKIIKLQSDKQLFYEDKELESIRKYRLPYNTLDVQKIFALHSMGSGKNKFSKSLKQTSINIKWYNLLDFTLPPITQQEIDLYYSKVNRYQHFTLEELNNISLNDFDRYVLPEYIKPMLDYNINDVFIVCEICRLKPDEIKLRYSISSGFKIDVLSSARANIADKLTTKFYSEMSGLSKEEFIEGRTERHRLSFNKIIFPHIKFKTKELQDLLEYMKTVYIYRTTKDDFSKEITFFGTTYTLACGGIHTKDSPIILKSNDNYTYVHFDYNSYYPSIIIGYSIYPAHLIKDIFVNMVKRLRDTRVKAKHTKDTEGYIIENVPNKISAEALKIVINAIYGKLGSDLFFLYDKFAQMQVTINGQLMTMTLVEELELNGIHVISANTDGIIIKLPNDKKEIFDNIVKNWNNTNKMQADSENYKIYFGRDVNNYIAVWDNETIEAKGDFNPEQHISDLKKGYDMPIIAKAVFNYLYKNIPVMQTLQEHKDILDFCKTQNVGRQFDVVYDEFNNGKWNTVYSQRHVRFYVANKGVILKKEHKVTKDRSVLASGLPVKILNTLDDTPIENRNINYKYYRDEAYKIIDPIMLKISPNQKGDRAKGTVSGKVSLRKYSQQYLTLFDEENN